MLAHLCLNLANAPSGIRDTADLSKLASLGCSAFVLAPAVASKLFTNSYSLEWAGEMAAAAQVRGCGFPGDVGLGRGMSKWGEWLQRHRQGAVSS